MTEQPWITCVKDSVSIINDGTPTEQAVYEPPTFELAPCFKSSVSHFFWFAVIMLMLVFGKSYLTSIYATSSLRDTLSPSSFVQITNAFIFFIAFVAISRIVLIFKNTFSHKLIVTPHHVEFVVGIMDKRSTKINISHIRTIEIEQTAQERLLDIGTIRIAAASTEGYEIDAFGINHPNKFRDFLKHRIGVLQYNEVPNPSITYD